ncbi:MAG: EamA family transporter [Deltaproteobacteria bacterium]|jgi:drug/metabolite transporter (DMT)-like permease|nr:EamA family transporter [Deltaproteobacteria bacterium]
MVRHQASGRSGLGFALAFTTMLLWAVLPLTLQVVLEQLDPVTITAFRFLAAALFLFPALRLRGALPRLRGLGRRGGFLLLLAIASLALNYVAFLLGLDATGAAFAQVMIQVAPLLLALGGIFVFGERFATLQWVGMLVLVLGILTFFSDQWSAPSKPEARILAGTLWMLIASVTWAVYGLAQKQLLTRLSSQGAMLCIYSGCGFLLAFGSTPGALLALEALPAAMLIFTAANTLLAYGAFSAALEHWEASRVSAVLALTPLGTLAFAVLAARLWPRVFETEVISSTALLGATAVVVGSLVVALGGANGRTVAEEVG